MINPKERAICERRGHEVDGLNVNESWKECKWCGVWLRKVCRLEEREDEPPEGEKDPLPGLWKKVRGAAATPPTP